MVTDFAGLSGSRCVQLVKKALRDAGIDPADLPFEAVQLVGLALDGADPRLAGPLDNPQAAKLAELCQKRCDRWPLQYLAGRWPFLDMELEVGPGVLIPRPDTEVLCLAAADCARRLGAGADHALADQLGGWPEAPEAAPASLAGPPRLLDLCAGTGCVGLGMARLLPQAQVTAVEKSPAAWPYLVRNTAASRVTPVQGDVMGLEKTLPGGWWVIASNPPYVTAREMEELSPEVAHEPEMALLGRDNGLEFYRYFVAHYPPLLAKGGWLAFEIGAAQGPAVAGLLRDAGASAVQILPDGAGRDRVVRGQFL